MIGRFFKRGHYSAVAFTRHTRLHTRFFMKNSSLSLSLFLLLLLLLLLLIVISFLPSLVSLFPLLRGFLSIGKGFERRFNSLNILVWTRVDGRGELMTSGGASVLTVEPFRIAIICNPTLGIGLIKAQ